LDQLGLDLALTEEKQVIKSSGSTEGEVATRALPDVFRHQRKTGAHISTIVKKRLLPFRFGVHVLVNNE